MSHSPSPSLRVFQSKLARSQQYKDCKFRIRLSLISLTRDFKQLLSNSESEDAFYL
jgi:hypothetical protein